MKKINKRINTLILLLLSTFILNTNSYAIDWGVTFVGDSRAYGLQPDLSPNSEEHIISNNSNGRLNHIFDDDTQEPAHGGTHLSEWVDWIQYHPNSFDDNYYITFISLGGNDIRSYIQDDLSFNYIIRHCSDHMETIIRYILNRSDTNVIISDIAPAWFRYFVEDQGFVLLLNDYYNEKFNQVLPMVNAAYASLVNELQIEYGNRVGMVNSYWDFFNNLSYEGYYLYEGLGFVHFNKTGNEAWAGLIADKIIELGWDVFETPCELPGQDIDCCE